MVGTSLFANYTTEQKEQGRLESINDLLIWLNGKEQDRGIKNSVVDFVDNYKLEDTPEWKNLKDKLRKFICKNDGRLNENASAEIQSIFEFSRHEQERGEQTTVYLIASDTIESYLIAQLLQESLNGKNQIKVIFYEDAHVIQGLQVKNEMLLQKAGMGNLINCFSAIYSGHTDEKVIINITGGYKGIIPILTFIQEIYNFKMIYMYEDTGKLMSIPKLPIKYDDNELEYLIIRNGEVPIYVGEDAAKKRIEELKVTYGENYKKKFTEKVSPIVIDIEGKFTPIGEILWKHFFEKKYNIFYMSDKIYERMMAREDVLNLLCRPMGELLSKRINRKENRKKHSTHTLFSDTGSTNNTARVYYYTDIKENAVKYKIYMVFGGKNEHEEHTKYILTDRHAAIKDTENDRTVKPRLIKCK